MKTLNTFYPDGPISAGILALALSFSLSSLALGSEPESGVELESLSAAQNLEEAYQFLVKTSALESAYVGFTLSRSLNLDALVFVLESGDSAEVQLRKLFTEGSLPGKMYAIIGFQLLQKNQAAAELSAELESRNAEIMKTYEGCVYDQVTVERALHKISEGVYRQSFLDAWKGNSQGPL